MERKRLRPQPLWLVSVLFRFRFQWQFVVDLVTSLRPADCNIQFISGGVGAGLGLLTVVMMIPCGGPRPYHRLHNLIEFAVFRFVDLVTNRYSIY